MGGGGGAGFFSSGFFASGLASFFGSVFFGSVFFGSSFGGGGITGAALMPGWLKRNACGSSRSVPVQVISTLVPAFAPHGDTVSRRGFGSWLPSCGWAWLFRPHTILTSAKLPTPSQRVTVLRRTIGTPQKTTPENQRSTG